jgi:hypothetical protein
MLEMRDRRVRRGTAKARSGRKSSLEDEILLRGFTDFDLC